MQNCTPLPNTVFRVVLHYGLESPTAELLNYISKSIDDYEETYKSDERTVTHLALWILNRTKDPIQLMPLLKHYLTPRWVENYMDSKRESLYPNAAAQVAKIIFRHSFACGNIPKALECETYVMQLADTLSKD